MDEPTINMKSSFTPRWIEMTRNGKTMWLDVIDGKLEVGGDLEPTEAARMFLDGLGDLLNDRIEEAARKLNAK